MNENNNDLYFKDCFTEQDGKINEEINKITMKCFNSKDNKFSMDCEGNLSVNSITTRVHSNSTSNFDIDTFYPIGAYFETSNESFDPNTAWGGTWVLDSPGRVTVSYDGNHEEFSSINKTGGEKEHLLTYEELPSHTHEMNLSGGSDKGRNNLILNDWTWSTTCQTHSGMIHLTGNNKSHNNLQPYVVVKRWHRIA